MPRWAPRLFTASLLLILGAVLGHAAEHEGWLRGVFHCSSVDICHGDDDGAPCDSAACHSHDEPAAVDLAMPPAPSIESARAILEAPSLVRILCPIAAAESLRPDIPIAPPPPAAWTAGCRPLLI
jgi:hypothetical protein